jgi:hypothetical protein
VVGSCEHGNELVDSIEGEKLFDQLEGLVYTFSYLK